MNALLPQGPVAGAGAGTGPGPGIPDPNAMMAQLNGAHDVARARFDKLSGLMDHMEKIKAELGQLSKLGDMVTMKDVISGAGALVAHGLDPKEIASMLADAPVGQGQALGGWVGEQAAKAQANEAKLAPALELARHQLGLAAFHLVGGHSVVEPADGSESQPMGDPMAQAGPGPGNALSPTGAA